MSHVSNTNFGLLIAYLIPGFLGVLTVKPYSAAPTSWMATSPGASPTVGGFLFVTVSAVFFGLLASTIRWLVLDPLHHRTGLPLPSWDFDEHKHETPPTNFKLGTLCEYFGVSLREEDAHDALADIRATVSLYRAMVRNTPPHSRAA